MVGWGVEDGEGLPSAFWAPQLGLFISQIPWKLGILPMKSGGLEGLTCLPTVTKLESHRTWIGWGPGLICLTHIYFFLSPSSLLGLFYFKKHRVGT